MIPTKPIIPQKETHKAPKREATNKEIKRKREVCTPTLLAKPSPASRALKRYPSKEKDKREANKTMPNIPFSPIVILSKFPKDQPTIAERATSSAKYCKRVVKAWKQEPKTIPTRTTVVG